jgi:hypothetical protein
MPENPSYLDRLYNEIGQLKDRVKGNFTDPSNVIRNFTTPYQSMEEQARLQAQQTKEDYMAIQDSEQPQPEQPRPPIPGLEDPYAQYLQENREVLKNPEYAAPTREEYKQYFTDGQAPLKAVPVSDAVAEMAVATPRQTVTRQQAPAQPQRPMTIGEQIDMLPFAGDRYEAKRKVMEKAKLAKINEAYAYADAVYNGVATVEGGRFIENTLKQIEANFIVPKPIEQTEAFNAAKEAIVSGKHADRLFMLGEMKGLLETAKTIKDKDEKVSFLELNLPKLAQSIAAGADAIQPAEASRIMPELNSVWQSPLQAVELFGRKGLGAFAKQPDVFIEKLGKIYNSTIPVINERSAGYQDNLGSAFKKLGVGYLAPIGTKNQGIDITKLQQLREGTQAQKPVFSQTNPADRPASTGPQIVPGMRGVVIPGSFTYGSKPMQLGF